MQRLHALDVATGAEKYAGPIVIKAKVKGRGDGAVNGFVHFDLLRNNQRAGRLLVNGLVYIAWASHCDNGPYHGWVMSYEARTLKQNGVWNSTPNAGLGGVWQLGGAPAADEDGNVYFATGNGGFDADTGGLDFGDSVLKLGMPLNGQLPVFDYFTPDDQQYLDDQDLDLGSGGPMLLPTQRPGPPHPHLLTLAGKGAVIYLIDRDNLGNFNPNNDDQIVQSLPGVRRAASAWGYRLVHGRGPASTTRWETKMTTSRRPNWRRKKKNWRSKAESVRRNGDAWSKGWRVIRSFWTGRLATGAEQ